MLVLPDWGFPLIIDNVNGPVVAKHCWFYDAELNDFLLRPIKLLEETTGQTVRVRINGYDFDVPASWNLLVVDDETKMVDTVPISKCSSSNYKAFLSHPSESSYALSSVVLLDLFPERSCVHVTVPKMHMLFHPVGQVATERSERVYSCLLSPQDLGKHMGTMTVMELLL